MPKDEVICDHCNVAVLEYYHDGYKGKRGKCPICRTDFPLE